MAFLRKDDDGRWVVCTRLSSHKKGKLSKDDNDRTKYKKVHLVKYSHGGTSPSLGFKCIACPQEFAGKRVKVVVEVMEDEK